MRSLTRLNQRLIGVALLWAFLLTIARGFQWPNDWAEAQWTISYSLGYMKRALPGSVLSLFYADETDPQQIEILIKVTSTIILGSFLAAIFAVLLRTVRRLSFSMDALLVGYVFVTSPYIVISADLNGYFDSVFGLLIIIAVALALRRRNWLACTVLAGGLLVHETIVILGCPIIALAIFAVHVRDDRVSGRWWDMMVRAGRSFVPLLLPITGFWLFLAWEIKFFGDRAAVNTSLIEHINRFPFVQNNADLYLAKSYTKSLVAFLELESKLFSSRILNLQCLMAVLPTLLGLLVLIRRQLGAVQFSSAYFWWLAAICVLPLSLHLVAFDTFRIWVYPLFVALLSLWVVCDTVTIAPPSRRAMSWLGACCLIVIPVNILVDYPLFNKNPLEITPDVKLLLYLPGLAVMALVCSKSEKGVLREERSHR